jgi:hypothetical protein
MSVLDVARVRVDPPAVLPVDYLSLSSIKLFMRCPERWRRRYIEKEIEPSSGKMVLGSAAGAALAQHYGHQMESGEGFGQEQLLDEFSSEWEERTEREEVAWGGESPGELKDSGAGALRVYHARFAPEVEPVSVEREIELSWPGVYWKVTGFMDLEDAAGRVRDYKMGKRVSQADADADLQPTTYLAARRAEGNPAAGFTFDNMIRNKTPTADVVSTTRSELQLDLLTDRIFTIAREIEWRCLTDTWSGAAPGTWFCSTCGYRDCPLRLGVPR